MQRRISIVLAASAYSLPVLWLQWQYHEMESSRPNGCGLWQLSAIFWGAIVAVVLSGTGTSIGVIAWRHLQQPRPGFRTAELVGIALPAAAGAGMISLIFPFFGVSLALITLALQFWLGMRPNKDGRT